MYKIPYECGRVYICETGRGMYEGIEDIRLSRTRTSAVSEHAKKTEHYTLWNKIGPHLNSINTERQWN